MKTYAVFVETELSAGKATRLVIEAVDFLSALAIATDQFGMNLKSLLILEVR